jgi:hypothetical protein
MLTQTVSLIVIMLGILSGEYVTSKVFGYPKKLLIILDIIIFAFIITFIFNRIGFYNINQIYYATIFFIGGITITFLRCIEGILGLTTFPINEHLVVHRLNELLSANGFTYEEIEKFFSEIKRENKTIDLVSSIQTHIKRLMNLGNSSI